MFKTKQTKPKIRGLYAFTKQRRGDFLLFINKQDDTVLEFMQLPDRYKVVLTTDEFAKGIKDGLLDFVEQIPEEVFEVAQANLNTLQNIS